MSAKPTGREPSEANDREAYLDAVVCGCIPLLLAVGLVGLAALLA